MGNLKLGNDCSVEHYKDNVLFVTIPKNKRIFFRNKFKNKGQALINKRKLPKCKKTRFLKLGSLL